MDALDFYTDRPFLAWYNTAQDKRHP